MIIVHHYYVRCCNKGLTSGSIPLSLFCVAKSRHQKFAQWAGRLPIEILIWNLLIWAKVLTRNCPKACYVFLQNKQASPMLNRWTMVICETTVCPMAALWRPCHRGICESFHIRWGGPASTDGLEQRPCLTASSPSDRQDAWMSCNAGMHENDHGSRS